MAMKPPPQLSHTVTASASVTSLHQPTVKDSLSPSKDPQLRTTAAESRAVNVPHILQMVIDPLRDYCHESHLTLPTPVPRQAHSQDDAGGDEEEINERRFGSISPIFHTSRNNSISSGSGTRANNMRLKFRKSHTCGSLFANCSCSSTNDMDSSQVQVASRTLVGGGSGGGHMQAQLSGSGDGDDRGGTRNASSPPHSFHLSISPSNADMATYASSSGRRTASSGVYSLSAQSSSATTASAQLSRDESMSVSLDCVAGSGSGPNSRQSSPSFIIGEGSFADVSLIEAKQRSGTLSESVTDELPSATSTSSGNRKPKTLQIPQIISPSPAELQVKSGPSRTLSVSPTSQRSERRGKRLFQSYSHPDTDFVFTEANKIPSRESLVQINIGQSESVFSTSRGGKVEIKQQKRSSSPNIGQFQVLDVAVHPDIIVKVSPKHSPICGESRRYSSSPGTISTAQQRRRLLQRSHEIDSGSSASESEQNFEVKSSDKEPVSIPVSAVSKPQSIATPAEDPSFVAAQKYFAESGILGPINTSSNLIRKTSKILQDVNVIEKIRKTSMILRANGSLNNSNNNSLRKQSSIISPSGIAPLNIPPSSPPLPLSSAAANQNVNMETPATVIYAPSSPKSPHTMATTCGFGPNVTTQSCIAIDDKDAQIKSLQGEVVSLKDVIKSRDAEIVKLRREIHKLKLGKALPSSVLQQTTNPLPIVNDDLLLPAASKSNKLRPFLPAQCAEITSTGAPAPLGQLCVNCRQKLLADPLIVDRERNGSISASSASSIDSIASESFQSCPSSLSLTSIAATVTATATAICSAGTTAVTCALAGPIEQAEVALDATAAELAAPEDPLPCNGLLKTKLLQMAHAPVLKKQGVSGESCETSMQQSINVPIQKYDKDYSSKQLIKDAIMDNDFLKNIDASQVRELVESMYPLAVAKGEFVIREGEVGAHLYVSAEGEFEVVRNGKVLGVMGPGKAFGELAILYNCTRTASVRVLSDARVWVLDRRIFQQIMMRTGMQRIENSVNFLKSVPLLKNLSVEVLAKIADVLEVEFYPAGTYIIRQGASGDTFFLISQGSVKVTQKISPSAEEKEIRILEPGDYFGEQALINEDKRTANIIAMSPGVECLTLDRESFTHLIGDLCELKEKNYGDENRVLAMKYAEKTKEIFGANVKQEFPDMKLSDLEVVATLGIGGFGRVELVKAYRENRVNIFALKRLKKRHILDTKQEEHVFSERTIMLSCNSPFICRLYRTFRDTKHVYMLLEACMGGEIWTMLRDRGSFDENATQFIIGCVLMAFEYLHSRGIIYRDLKPENLMLDERGYVKLVDFGFAKYIGNSSKTWTFCGTPEYVAPEIILNKGHDRAVDYWALGILIHELLNGTPPFTSNDPMKTYNIILKGIDMIDFPKHMGRSAVMLIKRLCRDVPAERLGYQKGGIQDIKKHKWFLGFDWDGLESQLLIPPFVRPTAHPTDTCYFDKFPSDDTEAPDELSGWDADF